MLGGRHQPRQAATNDDRLVDKHKKICCVGPLRSSRHENLRRRDRKKNPQARVQKRLDEKCLRKARWRCLEKSRFSFSGLFFVLSIPPYFWTGRLSMHCHLARQRAVLIGAEPLAATKKTVWRWKRLRTRDSFCEKKNCGSDNIPTARATTTTANGQCICGFRSAYRTVAVDPRRIGPHNDRTTGRDVHRPARPCPQTIGPKARSDTSIGRHPCRPVAVSGRQVG